MNCEKQPESPESPGCTGRQHDGARLGAFAHGNPSSCFDTLRQAQGPQAQGKDQGTGSGCGLSGRARGSQTVETLWAMA